MTGSRLSGRASMWIVRLNNRLNNSAMVVILDKKKGENENE